MAAPLSHQSSNCQGYFCHSCVSASVKGCHHSYGASSEGCCYVAQCPEPVRPPGFVHHLSLSALGPGSFGQLMVRWVLPNNLLTNRSVEWSDMHAHAREHSDMKTQPVYI